MCFYSGKFNIPNFTDLSTGISLAKQVQNINFRLCHFGNDMETIKKTLFTFSDTLKFPPYFFCNDRTYRRRTCISILNTGYNLFSGCIFFFLFAYSKLKSIKHKFIIFINSKYDYLCIRKSI